MASTSAGVLSRNSTKRLRYTPESAAPWSPPGMSMSLAFRFAAAAMRTMRMMKRMVPATPDRASCRRVSRRGKHGGRKSDLCIVF